MGRSHCFEWGVCFRCFGALKVLGCPSLNMKFNRFFRPACVGVTLFLAMGISPLRADPLLGVLGVQGARFWRQSQSLQEQRKRKNFLQSSEVTCGPTAVASLLTFAFGDPTTEEEIARLAGTFEARTSTLLGLRNACRAKGYEARGYQMTLPQLLQQIERGGVPVLVHYSQPSMHYALVLGQVGDFVLISDPSQGNISLRSGDFLRRWSGNALVVKSPRPTDASLVQKRQSSARTRIQTLQSAQDLPMARF